jgi:hypothetical protein
MKSRLNEGVGNRRIKRHNSISIDVRFALNTSHVMKRLWNGVSSYEPYNTDMDELRRQVSGLRSRLDSVAPATVAGEQVACLRKSELSIAIVKALK